MLQKSNPCVQRMVPTSEMEAAASTGNSVNTLPKYFQTPVTNPGNNTHNSTVIHDNIEEGFPVDHKNVGIHSATENQDSVREAVLTVQPRGSSHHVSGNTVLQTESVEHFQRHIPGLSTANTILSHFLFPAHRTILIYLYFNQWLLVKPLLLYSVLVP